MFVLELDASDVHTVLGRLLDRIRVAGLTLAALDAKAAAGKYRIRALIDASDREAVERLACHVGRIVGAAAIEVRDVICHAMTPMCDSVTAALRSKRRRA